MILSHNLGPEPPPPPTFYFLFCKFKSHTTWPVPRKLEGTQEQCDLYTRSDLSIRLNMEVDLQSLFGLHVTLCAQLYSLAEAQQLPPPIIFKVFFYHFWENEKFRKVFFNRICRKLTKLCCHKKLPQIFFLILSYTRFSVETNFCNFFLNIYFRENLLKFSCHQNIVPKLSLFLHVTGKFSFL